MCDYAFDFLESWIVENVNPTIFEDKEAAEHLAQDCVWEAQTRGIPPKAELIKAAGGNIDAYLLAEFNRAGDHIEIASQDVG